MMNKLFYALSIVFLLSVSSEAYAGFWAKRPVAATAAPMPIATAEPGASARLQAGAATTLPPDKYRGRDSFRGFAERGWVSIASVICGILGFFYPGFAFAAILFSFIGLSARKKHYLPVDRKRSHSGLAVVGLILGLFVAALVIFGGFTGFLF